MKTLPEKGWNEAILAEWKQVFFVFQINCQQPASAGERVNAEVYQELLRQNEFPGLRGCIMAEKYGFQQI